ncbi:MAG: septal ring lytic transglycosylase RlpA family protein [Pseudomonadota bacterium]|nr:septal ring lytic transglycosylase RlpA family protein [Pseudomonadota bacterium]
MGPRNAAAVLGISIGLAAMCSCMTGAIASGAGLPPAQKGLASVYSEHLNGKRTASGDRYDSNNLTAAHRTLPFGAEVRVTNLDNGKSVRVRVNDRGPHIQGRIVDLSSRAAAALGMKSGVARVKVEILGQPAHAGAGAHPRP